LQALFITGTDTDVGKTIVSAWLTLHWQASYWKPIQSGLIQGSDSDTVTRLSQAYCFPEKWKLNAPLSPHQAAALEHRYIDLSAIRLPTPARNPTHLPCKRLVVEGAGGLLTPVNQTACIADLILQLQLPVLLVARSSLGTINHTCLTIEALRARHAKLLGVIMVGAQNLANRAAIEHYGKTHVLAELPHLEEISQKQLQQYLLPEALKQALATVPDCPI
jgi:dethiobiotin synthetase